MPASRKLKIEINLPEVPEGQDDREAVYDRVDEALSQLAGGLSMDAPSCILDRTQVQWRNPW